MSREYALARVKDALEAAEGNTAEAQRTILNWLKKDQSLMIGLVAPHLRSIVSHAVDYVAHKDDAPKPAEAQSPAAKVKPKPKELKHDATGQDVLQSLLGQGTTGGPRFGDFDEPHSKPGKASAAHVDAINKIARRIDTDDK